MDCSAKPISIETILPWRDLFRREMNCQVIHDSIHARKGWTEAFLLFLGESPVGYGLIAVAGPWKGKPTAFEFYIEPQFRNRSFDLFQAFREVARPVAIEVQSNEPMLSLMLLTFGKNVASESILFHDKMTTHHPTPAKAVFRPVAFGDKIKNSRDGSETEPDGDWVIEIERTVVAAGGILFHYNRPYGDIFMNVAELYRQRGLGSYLVQELKRVAYEGGNIPAARCNPTNVASRKTLQKAGFVPCGHILNATLDP